MNWMDVLKIDQRDIFDDIDDPNDAVVSYRETKPERGYNAKEIIQRKDPSLFNKLNAHFNANPLINDEVKEAYDKRELVEIEHVDPVTGYDWSDAFIKHGFEDGMFKYFTYDVVDFLEDLGYEVRLTVTNIHNDRINFIGGHKGFIDVTGYSIPKRNLLRG